MKRKSNQRITKIKLDKIEELLKEAEKKNVEDACVVQPQGSDLTPYPDLERLRIWTHNYLLSGITKIFPNVDSDNSDDTYTVLIDGLPLYTKLLKSTKEIEIPEGKILNPILDQTGSPNITEDFIYTPSSFTDYISFSKTNLKVGTEIVLKVTFNSTVSDGKFQYLTAGPDPYTLQVSKTGDIVNFWDEDGQHDIVTAVADTPYYLKCVVTSITSGALQGSWSYSTDGTSYSTPVSGTSTSSIDTSIQYSIGCPNEPWSTTECSWLNGSIDLKESYILVDGIKQNFVIDGTATKILETTKPGLWLSNLLTPISESQAGSWLCHNLINSNEESYNSINADTFGNYCYSFIQRGLFYAKSEFGSYPESCTPAVGVYGSADLFNLQWSPGDRSCTSYRTLEGPNATGKFGNVYSTYSTIITPNDPDQQTYTEDNSKCLELTHINAPLKENLHTETYTSRLVGKDWSYELTFTPNGNGSGNDYGSGTSGGEAPNGSNGGCVTGTISYSIVNSDGDEVTCTQEVNDCFQTSQSIFNDNTPNHDDNDIGTASTGIFRGHKEVCAGLYGVTSWPGTSLPSGRCNVRIVNDVDNPPDDVSHAAYFRSESSETTSVSDCRFYIDGYSKPYIYAETFKTDGSLDKRYQARFKNDTGWCGTGWGYCYFKWILTSDLEPESGVNLYLNITDLKAEAEANGLPWDSSTCSTRFSIEVSTTKCTSSYCTSRLIASNVDINELGDISQLTTKVFT